MANDITKLPKWAQYEIKKLTSDLAYMNKKYQLLVDDWEKKYPDADTFIDGPDLTTHLPIGKGNTVSFVLNPDDRTPWRGIKVRVAKEGERYYLDINKGGMTMIVQPVASNCIRVS